MANSSSFKLMGTLEKMFTAVIAVRTKGALAGLNILLLALVFAILMVFGVNVTIPQSWLIITFLVVWQTFTVFSMFVLPTSVDEDRLANEKVPVVKGKNPKTTR